MSDWFFGLSVFAMAAIAAFSAPATGVTAASSDNSPSAT